MKRLLAVLALLVLTQQTIIAGDFRVAIDIGHEARYQPPTPDCNLSAITYDDLVAKGEAGCVSARGRTEHFYNSRIAYELFYALNDAGIYAFIINPNGKSISLMERTRLANKYDADLFISIHHDSTSKKHLIPWKFNGKSCSYCPDTFKGYGVFVSSKDKHFEESKKVGAIVAAKLKGYGLTPNASHKPTKTGNRLLLDNSVGLYDYKDLIVLKYSDSPSLLIECGVIKNKKEEELLNTPGHRNKIVNSIVEGVLAYRGRSAEEIRIALNK